MATALLALSEGPGGFRKLSVVKQLRLDLCEDPDFVAMFLDEARIAALLNHPNVVQTNEVGAEGHIRFISMEYLQGQSLARVLYRVQGRLPLGMHLRVIADALTGLHYVHELRDLSGKELKVVHRDISPGNIFVTYDGGVKVLDFGIAKAEGSRAVTEVGSFKGKMAYVAPEQARAATVDRRADIFSMGVLLWEALAKRPLVPREEADILSLQNRVKGLEQSIDEAAPDSPLALRQVCKKAMALNPDDRYSTAEEYRDALQEAAEGLQGGTQKDLGTVMNKLFTKEREAIAATIAKTISTKDPFKSDVEMIASWETSTSMSLQRLKHDDAITQELEKEDYSQASPSRAGSPSLARAGSPPALAGPASQPYPPYDPYSMVESASEVEISSLASTVLPLTMLAKSASYRNATLSIIALSLIIGFAAYFTGANDDDASESPEVVAKSVVELVPEVEALETAETQPEIPGNIRLDIELHPKAATVTINGEPIEGNPYSGSHALSAKEHDFVASAPGYKTSKRSVRLDRDRTLSFTLEKDEVEDTDMVIEPMELNSKKRKNSKDTNSSDKKVRKGKTRDQNGQRDNTRSRDKDTGTLASKKTKTEQDKKKTKTEQDKKTPRPGENLRRKRDKDKKTRKIDKDNPYN
jgi:serine/threonine-protein kinase